jgi:GT2 family glycosyltransferase
MTARSSIGTESIVDSRNGASPASAELSIIIVSWNSKDFVRRCLQSVYQHCSGTPFEVVVVDNASYDGCSEMLTREFPRVTYVQSEANVGFARANNFGVDHSSGRNLLFLNPDTEFLENSVKVLQRHLATLPEAGAVGCKLLNENRTLQTSCVQSFPTVFNQMVDSDFLRAHFPRWRIWGTEAFQRQGGAPVKVEVVSGACIAIKRAVFERVGGFTEGYFMYAEDADICRKIKQAGYAVYYVPETSIVHFGEGSSQKGTDNFSSVMMRESVHRYIAYNHGPFASFLYRVSMAFSSVVRVTLLLIASVLSRSSSLTRRNSIRKWLSVLRWSAGFEQIENRSEGSPEHKSVAVLDDVSRLS